MKITKTTIALIVLCFFTVQLKAEDSNQVSKTVRQGALQEALELIVKDLAGTGITQVDLGLNLDLKINPLPPLKPSTVKAKPTKKTPEAEAKSVPVKRRSPAPIVSPSKFRFGISDKEI